MGNRIRIGGGSSKVTASLRVFGEWLDPEDISRQLGCLPTSTTRKGDPLSYGRVSDIGMWSLQEDGSTIPETVVDALLAKLTPDLAVWHELGSKYRMDIFCGVFFGSENEGSGGFSLSPTLVQSLAERGLEIGFDIYWD